jgi:hypothetical protein
LLGPLVVTGVLSNVGHEALGPLCLDRDGCPGLRDSKKIFSQKNLARGEALALSLIEILSRERPTSLGRLVELLQCEAAGPWPPACVEGRVKAFCLCPDLALPLWCGRDDVDRLTGALGARLRAAGFEAGAVVSAVFCPYSLNRETGAGRNKFSLDLRAFLGVAHVLAGMSGRPVHAVAGKVGSRRDYDAELAAFFRTIPRQLKRSRDESAYAVGDRLTLRFILDADDAFVHVSMASIVGKYVREVFMESLVRACAALAGPAGRRPSGYRDRVTKEFIGRVRPRLEDHGIHPLCFERRR